MPRHFYRVWVFVAALCLAAFPAYGGKLDLEELNRIEKEMMQEGDYSTAFSRIAAIAEEHPDDAQVLISKAIALYGLMDYKSAYDLMEKATEKRPGDRDQLAKYAVEFIDSNRETLDVMEEKARVFGSGPAEEGAEAAHVLAEGHLKMLTKLLGEKYYYPALATAHIIWLERNAGGDIPGLYRLSAGVYYSAMLYKKASEDFEKALEEYPGDPELTVSAADCLVALGDLDKAGEYYAKAAGFYRKRGKEEDALRAEAADKVRLALPKSYKDVSEMMKEGLYDDAEKALRKRLSLNGADPAAILQLGQIRWEKGERNEAATFFARAAKIAPDYPIAHFYLGKSYAFRNDIKSAMKEFALFKEKMERLPPMDDDTVDFYVSALQYIGYIYSTAKDYKSAVRENEKALKLRPGDQDARYNMAIAYYYLGKVSRAYDELSKIIETDPSSDTADLARYCVDYIRSNPDPRLKKDFSFVNRD